MIISRLAQLLSAALIVPALCANSYDQLQGFGAADKQYFDAKYYAFFEDPASYQAASKRTIQLMVANPDLLPNYNFNIIEDVQMWINPCIYDILYCRTQSDRALLDDPLIEDSSLSSARRQPHRGLETPSLHLQVHQRVRTHARLRLLP